MISEADYCYIADTAETLSTSSMSDDGGGSSAETSTITCLVNVFLNIFDLDAAQ